MKDTQIIVRCSSDDKGWYEEAAVLAGKKLSAWVYDTLNDALDNSLGTVLSIDMSEEEAASLRGRAAEAGMSVPNYIKHICDLSAQSVESPVVPPPPAPTGNKRNYTGATSFMFHRKQYEYVDDSGKSMWTPEAP